MIRVFCLTAVAVLVLAAMVSARANDPTGTWLIPDGTAKVRIAPCSDALCGSIVWLSQPNDTDTGKPQTDKLNANPQLRSRPMLGVPVLYGMQRGGENSKWLGWIYNPDDGNTYRGSIEVLDMSRLKVQGCVTIYCQAEIWARAN
jgi:uncharacterized protein (DUF2147 family)